jgi:hypothetical protein
MQLQFRSVATATALIFSILAFALMFAPHRVVADWGLDVTLSVEVVCRRAAALFAGIAVMLFSARDAEPSVARSAMIKGIVAFCTLLASLGLFELNAGNVTPAILIPIFIEVALVLAFVAVGFGHAARPDSKRI